MAAQELAKAAYEQMLELPFYNTFFKTATPPDGAPGGARSRELLGGALSAMCSSTVAARRRSTR